VTLSLQLKSSAFCVALRWFSGAMAGHATANWPKLVPFDAVSQLCTTTGLVGEYGGQTEMAASRITWDNGLHALVGKSPEAVC
jgi:hypothetical protein